MRYLASLLVVFAFLNQCHCSIPSCCEETCECLFITKPDPAQIVESIPLILPPKVSFNKVERATNYALVATTESINLEHSYYYLGSVPQGPPKIA